MYGADLALIHDRWYDAIPLAASVHLKARLSGRESLSLLDLGCGSGVLLEQFQNCGNRLCGIDVSPAMIERCRARLPQAKLLVGDILTTEIPPADVVVMVGEILSYAAAAHEADEDLLLQFFQRVFSALHPKGIFLFDVLGSEHNYAGNFNQEHADYFISSIVSQQASSIHRHIVSFLKTGELYSKSIEDHALRTFPATQLHGLLTEAGFIANQVSHYGDTAMLPGRIAFECSKPA